MTGVRIANDARELQRRKEAQETRDRLLKVLEEEDKECMEKYHEITKKWPDILASKDPLHIHDELEAQNTECLKILENKDVLIAELKEELKNADLKYAEDVKKQNEDIDLLIERMENQVSFSILFFFFKQNLRDGTSKILFFCYNNVYRCVD